MKPMLLASKVVRGLVAVLLALLAVLLEGIFAWLKQDWLAHRRDGGHPAAQSRGQIASKIKPEHLWKHNQLDEKLPDELLEFIFTFLLPAELVRGPACVCQRWQRCSLRPDIWAAKVSFPWTKAEHPGFMQGWKLPRLYQALQARNLLSSLQPRRFNQWERCRTSSVHLSRLLEMGLSADEFALLLAAVMQG